MKAYTLPMLALGLCVAAAPAMAGDMDNSRKHDMAKQWFDKMDQDNDGMISIHEHERFSEGMFRKADTNEDNRISPEEFMNAKKREHKDVWMKEDKRGLNQ